MYVNPCFLTLVRSKADSLSDNPWKWWMVIAIVSLIEN
jgi:hypothetical protein